MSNQVKLDPHGIALMQQFRELMPTLEQLGKKAYDLLCDALHEQGVYVTAVEHRVKKEASLAKKLELKGAKYKSIDDVTDLVGLRIITFYTHDGHKDAAIATRTAVNQAELYPVSMMPFLSIFESFGFETLGDVQRFIEENSEDAYQLALSQLAITDLDIFSTTAAPLYLCQVYALKHDDRRKRLIFIYDTLNGKTDSNITQADMMLEQAKTLPFMHSE